MKKFLFALLMMVGISAGAQQNVITIKVKGVSFKMVKVQGGTFTMGATPERDSDVYYHEKPAHRVTLSSYYIGETEVTQTLWMAVMGSNPSELPSVGTSVALEMSSLYRAVDIYPVVNVSWNDCQTFIEKLNQLTGRKFRLPTEAEWEFAARGGNKSKGYKYSGSNTIGDVAWYGGNSGETTHPVKDKAPNELGIYDMSGNVQEWCQDWKGDYSSSAQTNPKGPGSGSYRVLRGGCWYSSDLECRTAIRPSYAPTAAGNYLGFRLAL